MTKIAIFASGSGSNAQAIAKHFSDTPMARVRLILTDNPNAYVLARAKVLGIPSYTFSVEELVNGTVLSMLRDYKIDFIVLAGFLKLVPGTIIEAFPQRVVNIHPALLPKYGGKGMYGHRVHKAVIEAGESESGITIHYVNDRYDEGDVIFQTRCPVLPNDTPESLAQRVHNLEHEHYPRVVEGLLS